MLIFFKIKQLSFAVEEDEEDEGDEKKESEGEEEEEKKEKEAEEGEKKWKIVKNPDVDTSFLRDREREEDENRLREELRQVSDPLHSVPEYHYNSLISTTVWEKKISDHV